jgi:2-keto-4-pentenoate hydratase/2-oxohepta-3-ene-1,7-dioic acid hydratase in catechol pathway
MFRLINVDGRAALHHGDDWYDLATLAGDPSLADPIAAVGRHDELHGLDDRCADTVPGGAVDAVTLGPPVPRPGQVFGIGLNYRDHAGESGMDLPSVPMVFTKFPSCIAGPTAEVPLSGTLVDWEVEIVAVVGREARRVPTEDAWDVVAGLTLGQDVSDRAVQLADQPPQFSMGKSFPAFGPIGPAIVPTDAIADRDDIGVVRTRRSAHAGWAHQRPDLLDPGADRLPLVDLHATAGRSGLHRYALRCRDGPGAVPGPG